jgi:hypothetical protein
MASKDKINFNDLLAAEGLKLWPEKYLRDENGGLTDDLNPEWVEWENQS